MATIAPLVSTTAIAMFHLFFAASDLAAAIKERAFSNEIGVPYAGKVDWAFTWPVNAQAKIKASAVEANFGVVLLIWKLSKNLKNVSLVT
jgi:hypothetical protein